MRMDFELCSVLFLILLLIRSVFRKSGEQPLSRSFLLLAGCVLLSQWMEMIAAKLGSMFGLGALGNDTLCCLMLCVQAAVPVMYRSCFVRPHRQQTARDYLRRAAAWIPYLCCAALLFTSIRSHYLFYTGMGKFQLGKYFWLLDANYIFYSVLAFVKAYRHPKRRSMPLSFCTEAIFMGGMPLVLIRFFPDMPLYCLCTSMMLLMMLGNQSDHTHVTDRISGALGREALMHDVHSIEETHRGGHVYALALDNFKLINETFGIEGGNELMRELVKALRGEFGRDHVYRFGGDIFAVYVRENAERAQTLDTLRQIFSRYYRIGDEMMRLTACVGIVHLSQHRAADFSFVLEYAVSQAKDAGKAAVFEMGETTTGVMNRRKAIEKAMLENIRKGHFEVHYQPIWDIRQQKFHSMEALARLNVPDYGYVSPEEFILIAEKNGTILQIGLLVLEEVCRFIRDAKLEQHGIEFVEVNLSVVQCTKDGIYKSIRDVIEKYNIPPSMINLEITESAAAYSEKKLIQNMARMTLMGLTFSLDDYGSGYSNINYLTSLPFTIVKIDKYLVWGAAKNPMSRQILEHTISMFKAIDLRIVTEGIEDPDMVKMVADMGADYIQGFYYSKPVPREQLLERLEPRYLEQFRSK